MKPPPPAVGAAPSTYICSFGKPGELISDVFRALAPALQLQALQQLAADWAQYRAHAQQDGARRPAFAISSGDWLKRLTALDADAPAKAQQAKDAAAAAKAVVSAQAKAKRATAAAAAARGRGDEAAALKADAVAAAAAAAAGGAAAVPPPPPAAAALPPARPQRTVPAAPSLPAAPSPDKKKKLKKPQKKKKQKKAGARPANVICVLLLWPLCFVLPVHTTPPCGDRPRGRMRRTAITGCR